jgi:hypothetical protein
MPDGPRYGDDFYAWTQYQAEVLRTMAVADNRFDRENVAEEVETLGRSERDAVHSQVRRVTEHLLKLAYSPAAEPRHGWMSSIAEARATLDDKISETLRRDAENTLAKLYQDTREIAEPALRGYSETEAADKLPAECPYPLEDILRRGWYPDFPGAKP